MVEYQMKNFKKKCKNAFNKQCIPHQNVSAEYNTSYHSVQKSADEIYQKINYCQKEKFIEIFKTCIKNHDFNEKIYIYNDLISWIDDGIFVKNNNIQTLIICIYNEIYNHYQELTKEINQKAENAGNIIADNVTDNAIDIVTDNHEIYKKINDLSKILYSLMETDYVIRRYNSDSVGVNSHISDGIKSSISDGIKSSSSDGIKSSSSDGINKLPIMEIIELKNNIDKVKENFDRIINEHRYYYPSQ
jgi:hypothetical protein